MKADNLTMTMLFDLYGELLTDRQRDCFDLHFNQDYSLAEIAEQLGISRQGVHDAVTRAESQLLRYEEVTGCLARERRELKIAEALETLADSLPDIRPDEAAKALAEAAAALRQAEN